MTRFTARLITSGGTIPGARPGTSGTAGSPFAEVRRNYRHQAAAGPRQIAAEVRARIAAQSPEHAALVAEYEAAQKGGMP